MTVNGNFTATNGVFSGDISVDDIIADDITCSDLTISASGSLTTGASSHVKIGGYIGAANSTTVDLGAPVEATCAMMPGRWRAVYAHNGNFSEDVAIGDDLAVIGDANIGGDITAKNLIPDVASTRDIGTASKRYSRFYVNDIFSSYSMATSTLTAQNVIATEDVYKTAYMAYTSTITGWSTATAPIYYKCIGKTVIVHFYIGGVSTAGTATFTIPVAADATKVASYHAAIYCVDDDVPQACPGMARLTPSSNPSLVECFKCFDGTVFISSNGKYAW